MTAPTPETGLDALMRDFAWTVHDFQRLANTLSLLVGSLGTEDDLDAPNFYTDIDRLVRPGHSPAERKIAAALGDEDRDVLRGLKKGRDDLVYRFFLDHRIDATKGAVPAGAAERLTQVRGQVAAGQAVIDRLFDALAAN